MKKNKLVLLATTGALLIGLTSVRAFAEEEQPKTEGETNTEVTFNEGNTLALNHVPSQFNFNTEVSNQIDYTIKGGAIKEENAENNYINKIVVFNNKAAQKWQVKVSLKNLEDTINKAEIKDSVLTIKSEKHKEGTANSTGTDNVVFENAGNSTTTNVGTFFNTVTGVDIAFKDSTRQIKGSSVLKGQVHYSLTTPTKVD